MKRNIDIMPRIYTWACVGLEAFAILLAYANGFIFWNHDQSFIRILTVFFTCIIVKRIIRVYERCWMLSNLFNTDLEEIEVDSGLNSTAVTIFMLSKKSKFAFRILACWIPTIMIYIIAGYNTLYTNDSVLITSMSMLVLIGIVCMMYVKKSKKNFISYCKKYGVKKITFVFSDREDQ